MEMVSASEKLSNVASPRTAPFDALNQFQSDQLPNEQSVWVAFRALQSDLIRFRHDKVIACEGEAADHLFLVIDGVVRSCKTFKNGSRSVVAFYLPGDLFGWSDPDRTLSVEAASDATVLFLKRKTLLSLASNESRIANFLLAAVSNELHRARQHVLLISMQAKSRVASFLSDLSKRSKNQNVVDLLMSHQDIADYLGIKPETLSRTITGFEHSGLVARNGKTRRLTLQTERLLSQVKD